MPRKKKKAKVIAEPSVPLENLAKAELGAWESSAPTLLRKFQEQLRELRPVDEEATDLLSSREAQRGAYLRSCAHAGCGWKLARNLSLMRK